MTGGTEAPHTSVQVPCPSLNINVVPNCFSSLSTLFAPLEQFTQARKAATHPHKVIP